MSANFASDLHLYNWAQSSSLEPRFDAEYYSREAISSALWQMKTHLNVKRLSDSEHCALITDGTHATPEYVKKGVPFLSATNLEPFHVSFTNHKWISEGAFEQLTRWNCSPLPNDILVAKSGSIGAAAINLRTESFSVFESVAIVRLKGKLDSAYVCTFLNTHFASSQIKRLQKGAVIRHLHLEEVRELRVPIPSDSIQRAIGNKVRNAERLRELAEAKWQRATQALENELSLSLKRETFDTFEPISTNSGSYQCVSIEPPVAWAKTGASIAAQYFHPRRIHAQHLVVKSGQWEKLSGVATRLRRRKTGSASPSRMVGLDQIDSRTGIIGEGSTDWEEGGQNIAFPPNSILFSRLRPNLNKVTIWPEDWGTGAGSGELLVYEPHGTIDTYYLFFVLKSNLGLYQVVDTTAGSTLPRLEAEVVDDIYVPRLDRDVEKRIGQWVREAHQALYAANDLTPTAKADVEALIDGTLDEEALLREDAETERWLKENPAS